MSTLVVSVQNNVSLADPSPLDSGLITGAGNEAVPGTGVATEVVIPISTDNLVYKLAELISALFCRFFGAPVDAPETWEEPDSEYLGCWPCCM